VTVDGLSSLVCTLTRAQDSSVTPTCDLAGLPVGTHTLVLVVSNVYACQTAPDGNSTVCYGGGSASSDPFTYTFNASAVSKPSRRFLP
jgi:hypothetical protein